jgi:hypothetical protein
MKTISARPRRQAARQIFSALRRNEVVLLIADEFKSGDVKVEFGSHCSCSLWSRDLGPTNWQCGCSYVCYAVVLGVTLRIGSEINLIKTGDLQEDVTANVVLFTCHLEVWCGAIPISGTGSAFNGTVRRSKNLRPHVP